MDRPVGRARRESFSALVVDVMMPHVDGVAVCRVLRADGDRTPVLMLTARTEVTDRTAGLDAGADDYLPKPFEVPELLARLRALLRRAALVPGSAPETEAPDRAGAVLRTGSLSIAPGARQAWWGESELRLTKTEFELLELLVRNEGLVLDHAMLYRQVWGPHLGVDAKNLASYIGYVRRKLAEAGAPLELIHTVRGVGYAVRRPHEPALPVRARLRRRRCRGGDGGRCAELPGRLRPRPRGDRPVAAVGDGGPGARPGAGSGTGPRRRDHRGPGPLSRS